MSFLSESVYEMAVDEVPVDFAGLSSSKDGGTPDDTPAPSDSGSWHEGEESEGGEEESSREENERMREGDKLVSREVEAYRVYRSTFSESMEASIRERFSYWF